MILLMLFLPVGHAELESALLEKAGYNDLTNAAEAAAGVDVRAVTEKLLSGQLQIDSDTIARWLRQWGESVCGGLLDALTALAAPVLASLAAKAILGDRGGGDAAVSLLCRASCVTLLMGRFVEARAICASALETTLKLTQTAAPVLASALTLTGAARRATILTPSATLCASLIESLLCGAALPLCSVAAMVAASANLSDRFRLNRLFELLRDAAQWGVRLMLSGFVGLMAVQGLLAGSTDVLSARAIRRAIQSALPIIGGEVSDSAGSLLTSALAVRGVAGVTGMLALLCASLGPVLRLASGMLSLKLASAVLEPVADRGMARILNSFADLSRMLLAVCAGGTLLAVLTLGACLAFSTL